MTKKVFEQQHERKQSSTNLFDRSHVKFHKGQVKAPSLNGVTIQEMDTAALRRLLDATIPARVEKAIRKELADRKRYSLDAAFAILKEESR